MNERGLVIGVIAALMLVLLLGGFGGGMMGGAWMGFGAIFMVLFWTAILLLIIWLYNQIKAPSSEAAAYSTLDILKKRYAKGEISLEEFLIANEKLRREYLL